MAFMNLRVVSTLLGLAIVTAQAGVIIDEPFKTDAKLPSHCSIDAGVLKISANGNGVCTYNVADNLVCARFVLAFKARQVAVPASDHHFGVLLIGANGKRLMLYARADALNRCLPDRYNETIGPISPALTVGPDAPWTEFRVLVDGQFVEANIDGKLVGSFTAEEGDVPPVAGISFYSHNLDIEVSSCRAESLAEGAGEPVVSGSGGPPDFYANFDGATDASSAVGEAIRPSKESSISYVDGVKGRAVFAGNAVPTDADGRKSPPLLQYDAGTLFSSQGGTVSFWFQPNRDGMADRGWRSLLTGQNADGKTKLNVWLWEWLRVDLPRKEMAPVAINRRMRDYAFKGDWIHIALAWEASGWTRLYVDGIPYRHGGSAWELTSRFTNLDLDCIKTVCVGSGADIPTERNADGAVDELKIYRRPIAEDEVVREYRSVMPVDVILDRAVLFAGMDEKLELLLAPGGTYARPAVGSIAPTPATVAIAMEFCENESGKSLLSNNRAATVNAPQKLEFPVGRLNAGVYRLKCRVSRDGATVQKSFLVSVYNPQPALPPTDAGLTTGAPLFIKDFAVEDDSGVLREGQCTVKSSTLGRYLEAGANNGDRIGFEIAFPETARNGKPVLLQIDWPDDVPRSMGLYMYPKTTSAQHRDRLEGGIQSGNEYPLTGKMQSTKYLFYPGLDSYLFEARTMIKGYPAALAKVTILPLDGDRFPKLKIEYPHGMPHRALGHMDEDQTVDFMLNYDDAKERASIQRVEKVLDRWCDYFDYTGQNAVSYPILRYDYTFCPQAGVYGNGCLPFRNGQVPAFIEMLNARGMSFIAIVNLYTLPDLTKTPDRKDEFVRKDLFSISSAGKLPQSAEWPKPNLLNPEVKGMLLWHITDLAARYGTLPGLDGIEIWAGILSLGLNDGYSDATVASFTQETGVQVPQDPAGKFKSRFAFLTGPAKDKWLRWRADKTTGLIREIETAVHAVNPQLKLYINIMGKPLCGSTEDETSEGLDTKACVYENAGLDIDAIAALPDVYVVPTRHSTSYRWEMFWAHPESTVDETIYDVAKFAPFSKSGIAYSNTYPTYYESFRKSLKQDVYNAYFQNADIKPFGRYFLKELVYSVAILDSQRILIGAQPLGSWGRDEEMREFAKAYCALPALPFKDVEGMRDPVTARYLNTANGTYAYLANLLWSDANAGLTLAPTAQVTDLSTGESLSADAEGSIKIELKPYQLRSFRIAGGDVKVAKQVVSIPDAVAAFYKTKLSELRTAMDAVAKSGEDTAKYKSRIDQIQTALDAGQYGEAHRLAFSKRMNSLLKVKQMAVDGFLKQQMTMIAASRYAVKCGGEAYVFYRSKSGTLFFPDQSFANGNYGYDGTHQNVVRNVDKVKSEDDPEIFRTEAYNLDAYRFKVKPGKYAVRMYFKAGYEPGFKPGVFVINVDIEKTRVLNGCDIVAACNSDFGAVLVKEFGGVQVDDGVLDIEFSIPEGVDASARLCNAIEVIPEDVK
ncbi:MAG: hypothetical protein A3K19_32105 [Lentisphaerae bacterium RIFOXYB12_FULL_65_16]|nr:MAG: hypothetical protein A3K18_10885 [Lentisphaerae bacterium RIFOXYA12_64_32]OGV88746.1 MAG: hypothetical protein A3K19_32105 [Lentisphaerae bacterium RIFOXYB12_FULL_65_16]